MFPSIQTIMPGRLSSSLHPLLIQLGIIVGAKQTELIALLHQSGSSQRLSQKPFSVDPAGMVSMDDTQTGPSGTHYSSNMITTHSCMPEIQETTTICLAPRL